MRVATIAGIPIRLHFTFLLFLVWIFLISRHEEARISAWLIPAIFLCVLLHELGHALTAKRFGVQTRDITLYPIGGVAMLQGRRPRPKEEFWIALAGPAVNVVIALLLAPFLFVFEGGIPWVTLSIMDKTLLQGVFIANVILPLFNMIPAFPMDGGRVLRAYLAMRMDETRATQVAGTIGQFFAILMGFAGLLLGGNIFMMIIAFFVFLGAQQEMQASVGLSLLADKKISDAMITRFRTIGSAASLEEAATLLLAGSQQDFPVIFGDEVLGVLTRGDIARGLATEGPTGYVSGTMRREFRRVAPNDPLERALELFNEGDSSPIMVMEGDSLIGMMTGENVSEFIMLEHARAQNRA